MFSFRPFASLLAIALTVCISSSAFAKVEAVKGKRYRLTSKHGPWMIMVAALRDVPEERRTEGGMSAWQAADELVYELRRKGIPAYAFLQDMRLQDVRENDGNASGRKSGQYIAQHEAIAVLAGNFRSADDEQAQIIMNWMKEKYEPEFMKDKKNGGIIAKTPGRPKVLSRAHLTTNPLMPPSEIKAASSTPLLRELNGDMQYSLLRNKGKYTLRIATYKGTSIVQVGNQVSERVEKSFANLFGNNLDAAGRKAWELTEALRAARKLGYDRDHEAWVFHDRYESYVTVGSFDSPDDPRISQLAKLFNGKTRIYEGKEVMTAEVMTIPRHVPVGQQPEKTWMFDTKPRLIEVPRLGR